MIMRLIVAFARWTWGVSPAFPTADISKDAWAVVVVFGVLIDIAAIALSTGVLIEWIKDRRARSANENKEKE